MSAARKTKLSVTIAPDLLTQIDDYAERTGIRSRSNVIEIWLRRAAQLDAARRLEQDTIAYYEGLTAAERLEHADWADFSTRAFEDRGAE